MGLQLTVLPSSPPCAAALKAAEAGAAAEAAEAAAKVAALEPQARQREFFEFLQV